MPPSQAAVKAVQKFRLHEIKGLPQHLLRFGPLLNSAASSSESQPAPIAPSLPNPFIPWKHPKTGRWYEPKYSLRRQAELVKKAKASGTLHLLPPGPKLPPSLLAKEIEKAGFSYAKPEEVVIEEKKELEEGDISSTSRSTPVAKSILDAVWAKPITWEGEFKERDVAGADVGARLYAAKKRMFKGHKWERVRAERVKKQRLLMRSMAGRIKSYKSYHKKRRPNPLKPWRGIKAPKLPF